MADNHLTFRCIDCRFLKPASAFARQRSGPPDRRSGYQSRCRECTTRYVRAWRAQRREQAAAR